MENLKTSSTFQLFWTYFLQAALTSHWWTYQVSLPFQSAVKQKTFMKSQEIWPSVTSSNHVQLSYVWFQPIKIYPPVRPLKSWEKLIHQAKGQSDVWLKLTSWTEVMMPEVFSKINKFLWELRPNLVSFPNSLNSVETTGALQFHFITQLLQLLWKLFP